jgi:hypothetical protein
VNGLSARHLVIILPPDFEDFDIARHSLDEILTRIKALETTILVRENFKSWLSAYSGKTFSFDVGKKNWLGFPDAGTCDAAHRIGADVVIDLTPRFSPFTSRLAAATEAPLRISLDHEHAAAFYNLIVTPSAERTLPERYQLLLAYV